MTEKNTQTQGDRTDPERIIAALRELRSPFALYESDIHQMVEKQLQKQAGEKNESGFDTNS